MRAVVYDTETYPNYFLIVMKFVGIDGYGMYEVSARRNDAWDLVRILPTLDRMIGFNNLAFDYPLVHYLYQSTVEGWLDQIGAEAMVHKLYQLAQEIIDTQRGERATHIVPHRNRIVPQADLMRIHHLNNRTRATSLKALQVAMRSPSVVDMPVAPGTVLTHEQMDVTADYCCHDVLETERFLHHSHTEISFREQLGTTWLCMSDTDIGKRTLRERLEKKSPGCTSLSSPRDKIDIGELIFPYIGFRYDAFGQVLSKLQETVVPALQIKNMFRGVQTHYRGLTYVYGMGGIHACMRGKTATHATDERCILDVDVTSYYPTLAIVNRLRPQHLGEDFCAEYNALFEERKTHAKGTRENKILKDALNAVFGDSNSQYSRGFYDPAFMLSITVNGQLLLSMLAETLMDVEGMTVSQANTDGLTMSFPRRNRRYVDEVLKWWEDGTKLKLESVEYAHMWSRDVNNYVAVTTSGKVKRKGDYEYNRQWYQDPSMLVVPRAVEAALVHGHDIEGFMRSRLTECPWDFLIRGRVRGTDKLIWKGNPAQKITRYYITTGLVGGPLVKIMKPLAGKTDIRETNFHDGRPVQIVDDFDGASLPHIDLDWYVKQAKRLMIS
jgi:hypothetical protein